MDLQELRKEDMVILCGFTGMKLGLFKVVAVSEKAVKIVKKNGEPLIFSRKTGKQLNPEKGREKYASKIIPDDGSFIPPREKEKKKRQLMERGAIDGKN